MANELLQCLVIGRQKNTLKRLGFGDFVEVNGAILCRECNEDGECRC
jgi:hypothetical protein